MQLIETDIWRELQKQALKKFSNQILDSKSIISSGDISLDFSTQHLDAKIIDLLYELAHECHLESAIKAIYSGEKVNTSESKSAMHTALRAPQKRKIFIDGFNIIPDIISTQNRMQEISTQIRAGEWFGYSNKPITDIVNIGIGGSQLGAVFCIHAFAELTAKNLMYHFISDIDSYAFDRTISKLSPETTLFIISSKSFNTKETIINAKKALNWIKTDKIDHHFIAVTANPEKAYALGIHHVLPIWDWVGGRYSLCSAINLITCIAIGFELFSELLAGAHAMDEHYRTTSFRQNVPVLLALLGIWNNNFLNLNQLLILTYGYRLDYFSNYIQQLDMESNGKSIDKFGQPVNYATAPIVWGGSGNQAQHSYYQLLSQGTHNIAAEYISIDSYSGSPVHRQCLGQKKILSKGLVRTAPALFSINHICLKNDSPRAFGALIAMYEHKIYTQSVIWQINAFDQPGVEESKMLIDNI
ncbi:MAG: glucose-6-phosphate isomerase [Legionella sp.]|nr:glucose-6-phosphate isomerase [Legionella sp.]